MDMFTWLHVLTEQELVVKPRRSAWLLFLTAGNLSSVTLKTSTSLAGPSPCPLLIESYQHQHPEHNPVRTPREA